MFLPRFSSRYSDESLGGDWLSRMFRFHRGLRSGLGSLCAAELVVMEEAG